jgi:4-aminobutyrate aminotransferase-like enzyme
MDDKLGILDLNALDQRHLDHLNAGTRALIARRHQTFGPDAPLFYRHPIHLVRGRGAWLYDADGRAYLDAYNNVASVGHCHPHVVEAIARQAATLAVNTRYLFDIVYAFAEKLLATMPAELTRVTMTCTGSESVDLALRIARHHTGGTGIIVTSHAYHGNTTAVAEISPSSGPAVPIGQHVRTVAPPDSYRNPAAGVGARLAEDVRRAIADLERHGIRFAALIVDSVFSSDGIFTEPPGFLTEAVAVVRAAGGLYIADEVQPGFGRTGAAMWGFLRHGLSPDLVAMGKPMGNGYPVAGVVLRPEILEDFARRCGYFNTFGGNPVAAAAALAVLEVIEGEDLIANAAAMGTRLQQGLKALQQRFPAIGDVRGAGLFAGVEFSRPGTTEADQALASRVVNGLRERCVLIGTAGPHGNVLKIRPPLCVGPAEVDLLVETLAVVLEQEER